MAIITKKKYILRKYKNMRHKVSKKKKKKKKKECAIMCDYLRRAEINVHSLMTLSYFGAIWYICTYIDGIP